MNSIVNGFAPLKPGFIHAHCYVCKRKQSNTPRAGYEPHEAYVISTVCEKHPGALHPEEFYFDAKGIEITEGVPE